MSTRNKRIRQDTPLHVITNLVNVDAIGVANLFSDRLTLDINCGYSYSNQSIKRRALGLISATSRETANCHGSFFHILNCMVASTQDKAIWRTGVIGTLCSWTEVVVSRNQSMRLSWQVKIWPMSAHMNIALCFRSK